MHRTFVIFSVYPPEYECIKRFAFLREYATLLGMKLWVWEESVCVVTESNLSYVCVDM